MTSQIKQRLVGACILLAIAVIFVPVLFDRDTMEPIDTQTQIPIEPVIESIDIPPPEAKAYADAKDNSQENSGDNTSEQTASRSRFLFSPRVDAPQDGEEPVLPEVDASNTSDDKSTLNNKAASIKKVLEPASKTAKRPADADDSTQSIVKLDKPTTSISANNSGFWILQLASFRDAGTAKDFSKKVQRAGYKSYVETVDTPAGKRSRVFVGPFTSRELIEKEKTKVDKRFNVQSLVVSFKP